MRNTVLPSLLALCAAIPAFGQVPAPPQPDPRGGISGAWYNPQQSGHGLHIERLDGGQVALSWYTFDASGAPLWLVATGDQHGHSITATAFEVRGGRPPPLWDAAMIEQIAWGELQIDFSGCNDAVLAWSSNNPDFGAGELPIRRLTRIEGSRCNAENEFSRQLAWSFQLGDAGFVPLFADLPEEPGDLYELDARWERLPPPLQSRAGIRLSGHNRSDDLAMLVKAPVTGLEPNALYRVELDLELASNVPTGCAGIGGSPGDAVYLKLGASTLEPLALPQDEGSQSVLRLNIDFGLQSQSGADALVVGTLATADDCEAGPEVDWTLRDYSTRGTPFRARADEQGRLWLVAGSDSGFEGLTTYYLTALRARLQAVDEGTP